MPILAVAGAMNANTTAAVATAVRPTNALILASWSLSSNFCYRTCCVGGPQVRSPEITQAANRLRCSRASRRSLPVKLAGAAGLRLAAARPPA